MSDRESATRPARRRMLGLGAAAAVAAGLTGLWAVHEGGSAIRVRAIAAPATMPADLAEAIARRVAAVDADVAAVWRNALGALGRGYRRPEVIAFAGERPSPCGGAGTRTGPFYCSRDATLSFDLAFLHRLEVQLRAEGKRAVALVVARGHAEHVQAELAILGDAERSRGGLDGAERQLLGEALALQADCLTGLWARQAEGRLGPVAPGTWERIVASARGVAPAAAASAGLDRRQPAEREAAFATGYAAGEIGACLGPGLSGVLG